MMLGIEVGPSVLRGACTIAGNPRAATEPFSGRVGDLSSAISALIATIGSNKEPVALAIPSHWCSYRTVAFPYSSAARVEGTLNYALEDRLPLPVEQCIVEPLSELLPTGENGSRTLVAACPIETVSSLIEACRTAGVEPAVIQPAVLAAARALRAQLGTQINSSLMVRIDGNFCELAWIGEGDLRSVQVFNISDLSKDAEALALRIRLAVRSYDASEGWESFGQVFLFAAEKKCPHLDDSLREVLGTPVNVVNDDKTDPLFAAVRGVAMSAAEDGYLGVNLRRGSCAYTPHARRTDLKIAAALLIAAGIALVFAVKTARDIWDVRNAIAQSKTHQAKLFAEVVGRSGMPSLRPMKGALAALQAEADRTGSANVTSCLRRWMELMAYVPESSSITFDTIDIKQGGVTIKGHAKYSDEVGRFRTRLSESGAFLPDPPSVTHDRSGNGVSFTMNLRYRP